MAMLLPSNEAGKWLVATIALNVTAITAVGRTCC
jgi:hypothetical protein